MVFTVNGHRCYPIREIWFRTPEYKEESEILNKDRKKIFLGGTIDDGNSENWQKKLSQSLRDYFVKNGLPPIRVYSPRNENWKPNSTAEEMDKQIEWELNHLEQADLIIMNILENSKSPISLMEIGLFARKGNMIVFCTPNFYRYENVKMVCQKYNIKLLNTNDNNVIQQEIFKFITNSKTKFIK